MDNKIKYGERTIWAGALVGMISAMAIGGNVDIEIAGPVKMLTEIQTERVQRWINDLWGHNATQLVCTFYDGQSECQAYLLENVDEDAVPSNARIIKEN